MIRDENVLGIEDGDRRLVHIKYYFSMLDFKLKGMFTLTKWSVFIIKAINFVWIACITVASFPCPLSQILSHFNEKTSTGILNFDSRKFFWRLQRPL